MLSPQSAGTYSAIGYVRALMGHTEEAVDWFHKALGLKRDDTFSTTMLGYVIEQLSEEQPAYPGKLLISLLLWPFWRWNLERKHQN